VHSICLKRAQVAVAGLCLLGCGFMAIAGAEAANSTPPCENPEMASASGMCVELTHDGPIRFDFDWKRGTSDRTVTVNAVPGLRSGAHVVATVEGDLDRSDLGDSFPLEGVNIVPKVMPGTGNLQLSIRLDPNVERVEPGRYLGTIQVTGRGIQPTAIPIEATLASEFYEPILWIVLGLVFGLVLKGLADIQREATTIDRKLLRSYVRRTGFFLAATAGILTAVFSYFAVYASDDVWGQNPADGVKIAAVGVLSQVTGMTAVDIASPFKVPMTGTASTNK
jgi:hypothetical protein